jgi:hypothetical protein
LFLAKCDKCPSVPGFPQNLTARKIALLVLSINNWSFIQRQTGTIKAAIAAVKPGSYIEVTIPSAQVPSRPEGTRLPSLFLCGFFAVNVDR